MLWSQFKAAVAELRRRWWHCCEKEFGLQLRWEVGTTFAESTMSLILMMMLKFQLMVRKSMRTTVENRVGDCCCKSCKMRLFSIYVAKRGVCRCCGKRWELHLQKGMGTAVVRRNGDCCCEKELGLLLWEGMRNALVRSDEDYCCEKGWGLLLWEGMRTAVVEGIGTTVSAVAVRKQNCCCRKMIIAVNERG